MRGWVLVAALFCGGCVTETVRQSADLTRQYGELAVVDGIPAGSELASGLHSVAAETSRRLGVPVSPLVLDVQAPVQQANALVQESQQEEAAQRSFLEGVKDTAVGLFPWLGGALPIVAGVYEFLRRKSNKIIKATIQGVEVYRKAVDAKNSKNLAAAIKTTADAAAVGKELYGLVQEYTKEQKG